MSNTNGCPICDASGGTKIGIKNSFDIVRCGNCETLFSRESDEPIERFDYSNYYNDENLSVPEFVNENYRKILEGFEAHRVGNRFLDVGCGAGTLLDIAIELGWDAKGVEVSKPAAEHLVNRGIDVFEGTLSDADFPDNYFDVITCTEVIEHVSDPKSVISEIARVLSPNGILWMTTPHGNGLSAKLLGSKWSVVAPPEHLNLFSLKALEMCLRDVGFTKCKLVSHGFNPLELFNALVGSKQDEDISSCENSAITNTDEREPTENFNRVEQSYRLNKWFLDGKNKQKVKIAINSVLSSVGVGDTIKAWATFE